MDTQNGDFAKVPDFWIAELEDVGRHISQLPDWEVQEIARSAENRPVWACTFGPKKKIKRTSNLSASYFAGCPEAFWGTGDNPACFFYLAGVHGAETEGVVAAVNLLNIMQNGVDLRGREWPAITRAAKGIRLVVVPVANPDGRARVKPQSLAGMTDTDLRYWGQGRWKTGDDIGYPACKKHQPLPLDEVEFPGGYPNGAGFNIQHDCMPGHVETSEAQAIFDLVREEVPDGFINAHSYELNPGVLGDSNVLPEYVVHQRLAAKAVFKAMESRGLRPNKYWESPGFNLSTAIHYACGAMGFTFESPHGLQSNPYSLEEILECNLAAVEGFLTFGMEHGYRPSEIKPKGHHPD